MNKIYQSAEKNIQPYVVAMTIVALYTMSSHLVIFFQSFYNIYIGDFDTSNWPLLHDFYFPFVTNSLCGWYFLWCFGFVAEILYCVIMPSSTSYFISVCLYICAICDHFEYLMEKIRNDIEQNQHEKNPRKYEKRYRKISEQMHKAIELHIQIYQ